MPGKAISASEAETKRTYQEIEQREAKFPLIRIIVVFSVIIMLLNASIMVMRAVEAWKESLHGARQDTERINRTLAEQVGLTFLTVDSTIKRVAERQYFNALFGNHLLKDMQNNFVAWVNETPPISGMMMTNQYGAPQVAYAKPEYAAWLASQKNIHETPYFQAHAQSDNPDLLYINWVASDKNNHDGFVVMTRRISQLNGRFGGVVMAVIDSDYILDFFRSIEVGKQTRFLLMRDSNAYHREAFYTPQTTYQLLINQVQQEEELALIEEAMQTYGVWEGKKEAQAIVQKKGFDERLRVLSFSHLPSMPLIVGIVTYEDDIFNLWYTERINDAIFLIVFALFVLVISLFAMAVARQIRRVESSERSAVLASQAKSDFLANMSHELRTPLNAVIGFSEMLQAGYFGKLNAKQSERVHDIHYCGTHLLELINDILEFSKGEAGKIELRNESVSLSKAINDTVRIFHERARKGKHVSLSSDLPPDMPRLMADERKVKQILLNLISNAVKFTDDGGRVEISGGIDASGYLFLSVTDTGCGIAPEDITKALSAFGQVHNDPSKGGTGLGLPLCKMFAELHDGELVIDSIQGIGTKVMVLFPPERILWSQTSAAGAPPLPEEGPPPNKEAEGPEGKQDFANKKQAANDV